MLYEWKVNRAVGDLFLDWIADHTGIPYEDLWWKCNRVHWLGWLSLQLGANRSTIETATREIIHSLAELLPLDNQLHKALKTFNQWVVGRANIDEYDDARDLAWSIYELEFIKPVCGIVGDLAFAIWSASHGVDEDNAIYYALSRCDGLAYRIAPNNEGQKKLATIFRGTVVRPEWPT